MEGERYAGQGPEIEHLNPPQIETGIEQALWRKSDDKIWRRTGDPKGTDQGYTLTSKGQTFLHAPGAVAADSLFNIQKDGSVFRLYARLSRSVGTVDITGMTETLLPDATAAGKRVDFTCEVEFLCPPNFPDFLRSPNIKDRLESCAGEAFFRQYDDGWRLETIDVHQR